MYAGDPGGHKGLDLLFDLWGDPDRRPAATLVAAVTRPPTRATPPGVAVHAMGRQDVRAAFRQAALAVVPSLWDEPYGMVAVEALTAGTPVVASRAGALPEIVRDGVDGLLVPPGDAEALRTALQRLLGDEKARAQMSLAAKLGASRFSADTVVPRIEAAYDEVRSKARHG
jgi:glycosyltransferase involved in cell wall biosynthesis